MPQEPRRSTADGDRRRVRAGADVNTHARARAHRQVLVDDQRHLLARQLHRIVVPPNVHQPCHRSPARSGARSRSWYHGIPPSDSPKTFARSLAGRYPPARSGIRLTLTYVHDATRRDGRLRGGSVRFLVGRRDSHDGVRDANRVTVLYPGNITHRLPFATYGVAVYRFSTSAPRRRAASLSPPVTTFNASPSRVASRGSAILAYFSSLFSSLPFSPNHGPFPPISPLANATGGKPTTPKTFDETRRGGRLSRGSTNVRSFRI